MVTKVTSKVIGSDVTDVNLADNSVGTSELKTNAVTTDKITAQAVTTIKIVDAGVTTAKILDRNVTSSKIALLGVLTENINDGAVTTIKLNTQAVTTAKIADLNVTTGKLADAAVTTAKIGDDQVTRPKIGPAAVGTDEIATNVVSLDKIVKGNQGAIPVCASNGDLNFLNPGAENAVLAIRSGVPFWSTQVFFPGFVMAYAGTTAPTGWVLMNGMAIGDASSSANGRSNADCQALFLLLWESCPNDILPVSGGRGASAAADWAAHKTIQLPDGRGRVLLGRDAMGYTEADRITAQTTDTPDQVGATGGIEANTLGSQHVPPHRHWTFTIDEHYGSGYPAISPSTYSMRSGGNDNYKYTIRSANSAVEPTLGLTSNAVVNGSVVNPTPAPVDNLPPFVIMSAIIKL